MDKLSEQLFTKTKQNKTLGHLIEMVPTKWLLSIANPNPTNYSDLKNGKLVYMDTLYQDMLKNGMGDPLILGVGLSTNRVRLESGNHRVRIFDSKGIKLTPVVALVKDSSITSIGNGEHLGDLMELKKDGFNDHLLNTYMKPSSIINNIPDINSVTEKTIRLIENITIPQSIIDKVKDDTMLEDFIDYGPKVERTAICLNNTIVGFFTPKMYEYKGKMYYRTGVIYILPMFRESGIGTKAVMEYFKDKPNGLAYIEPRNVASLKTFTKAGFIIEGEKMGRVNGKENGKVFWRLIKDKNGILPNFLSW
jgi:hypothetical protein